MVPLTVRIEKCGWVWGSVGSVLCEHVSSVEEYSLIDDDEKMLTMTNIMTKRLVSSNAGFKRFILTITIQKRGFEVG